METWKIVRRGRINSGTDRSIGVKAGVLWIEADMVVRTQASVEGVAVEDMPLGSDRSVRCIKVRDYLNLLRMVSTNREYNEVRSVFVDLAAFAEAKI